MPMGVKDDPAAGVTIQELAVIQIFRKATDLLQKK